MQILVSLLSLLLLTGVARGATLQVGPGRTYTKPCQAILAAAAGDTIEIDGIDGSGNQLEYVNDFCTWSTANLTIRGVIPGGGTPVCWSGAPRTCPHVRSDGGQLPGNQGIWRIQNGSSPGPVTLLTVENIEMSGAHGKNRNAQPIWPGWSDYTYTNIYFHHNDNGIITQNEPTVGASRQYKVHITKSELAWNGGDAMSVNTGAQQHNLYLGQILECWVEDNWIHDSLRGQDVKTRCNTGHILNNRLGDYQANGQLYCPTCVPNFMLTGYSNYELDMSVGGIYYVMGNVIHQSAATGNKILTIYNYEVPSAGQENGPHELYMTGNTLVTDVADSNTMFLLTSLATPAVLTLKNNIWAGAGTGSIVWASGPSKTPQTDPANNTKCTTVAACNFTDALNLNFHLTASSPAVNAGVDAGTAHGVSLNWDSYYQHPFGRATRVNSGARDSGAYELNPTLGTTVPPPIAWTTALTTGVTVSWVSSLADAPILQHRVLRDGVVIQTVTGALTYTDTTAVLGTTYNYAVIADTAGASSAPSAVAKGTRLRQVTSGGGLSAALGWQEILSTSFNSVANPSANANLLFNRTGMTYDDAGNRVLLWGDGVSRPDNSVYSFDFDDLQLHQLNTSDTITGTADQLANGRPNARQTYNSLTWVPWLGKMMQWGGSITNFVSSIWLWTPGTDTWQAPSPTGTVPTASGAYAIADPDINKIWIATEGCLDRYNPATNAYERPWACVTMPVSLSTGVLDRGHRRLYRFGFTFGGYHDLNTGTWTYLTGSGCNGLMANFPGLAYDETTQKIVGWLGGDVVYLLDPATNTCTTQVIPGGPGFATDVESYSVGQRLQRVPSINAFLAFTDTSKNAFVLRLGTPTSLIKKLGGKASLKGKGGLH